MLPNRASKLNAEYRNCLAFNFSRFASSSMGLWEDMALKQKQKQTLFSKSRILFVFRFHHHNRTAGPRYGDVGESTESSVSNYLF